MSTAVITPRQLTATMVVCASDSLETWRASWSASLGRYLICDGTADDVEINAAITALPTTGGVLQLTDGHYTISSSILLNNYGMTLAGMKYGSYIILADGSNCDMIYVSKSRITIKDLHLEGNSAGQASGDGIQIGTAGEAAPNKVVETYMYNVFVGDVKECGIRMDNDAAYLPGSQGLYGTMIEVVAPGGDGWHFAYTSDVKINNASAQTCGQHGFNLQYCVECFLSTVSADACGVNGFEIYNSSRIMLTNFWAGSNDELGINIDNASTNNSITNGVCYTNAKGGAPIYSAEIRLNSAIGNTLSNLIIYNVDDGWRQCIRFQDYNTNNIITGCEMRATGTDGAGIYISGVGNERNRVSENFIQATRHIYESTPGYLLPSNRVYDQHVDLFMDVLAVSATHVRSNEDLSEAIPNTFTLDAQPDVPRTLSGHFDAHANITAYTIVITGRDAKGHIISETKTEADLWDWETSNAFATITSIVMTARTGTGVGDTMDIGITDVLGLSNQIYNDSTVYGVNDIFKIKKNNANAVVAAAQTNTTYDTYDMAVIGLAATDDFTIYFRSNLNVLV